MERRSRISGRISVEKKPDLRPSTDLRHFESQEFSGGDVDPVDGVADDGDGRVLPDDRRVERRQRRVVKTSPVVGQGHALWNHL